MPSAIEKAHRFLEEEKAFRLGQLPTESFHPRTANLSQVAAQDLEAGIRLLQSVDDDIPPVAEKVLDSSVFAEMVDCFLERIKTGKRIFFTGCGATGRLSILLEAAWRSFWQELRAKHPAVFSQMPDRENITCSVMAGGDFALIKSVEGFEDFADFGRHQLKKAGARKGDMVVAITEGGETSFVIGTAWQGLDSCADVFFVYNNPTDILQKHVERSRRVIEEARIRKVDIYTGPMAISGSTRMQATTIELLIVAAALEIALTQFLAHSLSQPQLNQIGIATSKPGNYHRMFRQLLTDLSTQSAVEQIAAIAQLEQDIYQQHGLVTYLADEFMLDVLTDTTERSPTFMLPPFRRFDDTVSPRSWAFAKNPFYPTDEAWHKMLRRPPRGLDWDHTVYAKIKAPQTLQDNPPLLDNNEIYKFRIGDEPDPSRTDAARSALIAVAVGDEREMTAALQDHASNFTQTAAICIGTQNPDHRADQTFHFQCDLPQSPLKLTHHLVVKLVLNTLSTITMTRMGRVVGNAMVWVSPSNKKLIDRGCRLIAQQTGCTYEKACIELHKAIEQAESQAKIGREVSSPVAVVIHKLAPQKDL